MAGDPVPLVSNVSYSPFGPANTITFANGRTLTKTYDHDYAISAIGSSDPNGLALTAQVDALGNLTHATLPGATRAYAYDPLYRLTAANDGNGVAVESYSYNLTGDRTSKTLSGVSQTYAYPAPLTSHRLQSVAGSGRTYDAAGNTTQIGSTTFTYDDRNRLTAASSASYVYNGKGERVVKRVGTQDTIFIYGPDGNLLAEYASPFSCNNPNFFNCDPNFNGLSWPTEYLWLDGTMIGVVRNGNPYYVETDQLGSPRKIVQPGYPSNDPDYGDKVVWSWDYAASTFGENAPNQDPSNSGSAFVMNVRFPGQYYDSETGLHYNYFRDYEPGTGRYIESDPIGLDGGTATYAYADGNSLLLVDPDGRNPLPLIIRICARFPTVCAAVAECRLFPAKCVELLCKANAALSRYKVHCLIPGCEQAENPWAREFKTISACTCFVNRIFEKYVCKKGISDPPHDDQIEYARKKCVDCAQKCVL
jgi:RHS repeat-associated protein